MLSVAAVGDVDHGKSTVLGRLLADGGRPGARPPADFAHVLDALGAERTGAMTIETTTAVLERDGARVCLVDVPGHAELLANAVSGMSHADVALLVVDAMSGVTPRALRHLRILDVLGVRRCVVAFNKVDLLGYAEVACVEGLRSVARPLHGRPLPVPFEVVPVSGLHGDNVVERSSRMPWYGGATLLAALVAAAPPSVRRHMRVRVQDVYGSGSRRIWAVRVESGTIRTGDTVAAAPSAMRCRVIEVLGGSRAGAAAAGECAGLRFRDGHGPHPGDVLGPCDARPAAATRLRVRLALLSGDAGWAGGVQRMRCLSADAGARVVEWSEDPDMPGVGSAVLALEHAVALERFAEHPSLGRIALQDGQRRFVAAGTVEAVEAVRV